MERKKKLRIIQFLLLIIGTIIIFYTYLNKSKNDKTEIITSETQEKLKKQIDNNQNQGDTFYNIEYSGVDLAGNRYRLKSKEASNIKSNKEVVKMKFVEAIFYFKDDTVLNIQSNYGIYNNRTLDMTFSGDVQAFYHGSKLFAQKAEYSNSESFLTISEKVKIDDTRGIMFADKLLFDIKKQTLNIASFNDGKIDANVMLK